MLCRMEKEWASEGMRWITGVVGSHGCSRLWARAPRMLLPGELLSGLFVGDYLARVDVGDNAFYGRRWTCFVIGEDLGSLWASKV